MTKKERQQPQIINESRINRIAKGSGRSRKEIHNLLKRFNMMRDVMKKMGKSGGLLSRIPGLNRIPGLGGGLNPADLMSAGMPGMDRGSGGQHQLSASDRKKLKAKRKQAKKDRKKSRKR
jgi:hypothetical protein